MPGVAYIPRTILEPQQQLQQGAWLHNPRARMTHDRWCDVCINMMYKAPPARTGPSAAGPGPRPTPATGSQACRHTHTHTQPPHTLQRAPRPPVRACIAAAGRPPCVHSHPLQPAISCGVRLWHATCPAPYKWPRLQHAAACSARGQHTARGTRVVGQRCEHAARCTPYLTPQAGGCAGAQAAVWGNAPLHAPARQACFSRLTSADKRAAAARQQDAQQTSIQHAAGGDADASGRVKQLEPRPEQQRDWLRGARPYRRPTVYFSLPRAQAAAR